MPVVIIYRIVTSGLIFRDIGKEKKMTGIALIKIFLCVVDDLAAQPRLSALSNQGGYINFRSDDFKKKLKDVLQNYPGSKKSKAFLDSFKTLQLIVCDQDRFTNVQNINGKSVRVITVDKAKYDLLKSLEWQNTEE